MIVSCRACGRRLTVPRISELKRQSGDATPHFNNLQKLAQARHDRTHPFDGTCQKCRKRQAAMERWVTFDFLVKRDVSTYEGIQPSIGPSGPGLSLAVGGSKERWKRVQIPLLFCEECEIEFDTKWTRSSISSTVRSVVAFMVLTPIIVAGLIFAAIAPCITVPAAILIMMMTMRQMNRQKVNPYVFDTLRKIHLVGVVVSAEDEYEINVADPQPWQSRTNES